MTSSAPLDCALATCGMARLAAAAEAVRRNSLRLMLIQSYSNTKTLAACKIEAKLETKPRHYNIRQSCNRRAPQRAREP
jgi:hypothetical protein